MLHDARRLRETLGLGASLCLGTACLGTEVEAPENPGLETAPMVASLELASGNVVEFYDYGRGVLITELRDPEGQFSYQPNGEGADQLTAIWSRLAPEVEVPASLSALQQRLNDRTRHVPDRTPTTVAARTAAERFEVEVSTATSAVEPREVGASIQSLTAGHGANCHNGCCNQDWVLSNIDLCHETSGEDTWFVFDEPRPQHRNDDVFEFHAAVCAVDDSTWDVTIGDTTTPIDVPGTKVRQADWIADTIDLDLIGTNTWDDFPVSSIVRTSEIDGHIGTATYCGSVFMDD